MRNDHKRRGDLPSSNEKSPREATPRSRRHRGLRVLPRRSEGGWAAETDRSSCLRSRRLPWLRMSAAPSPFRILKDERAKKTSVSGGTPSKHAAPARYTHESGRRQAEARRCVPHGADGFDPGNGAAWATASREAPRLGHRSTLSAACRLLIVLSTIALLGIPPLPFRYGSVPHGCVDAKGERESVRAAATTALRPSG